MAPITHTPQNCRWAEPTLFLPLPNWLDAWDSPWTCVRDTPVRVLESTAECHTCTRWQARAHVDDVAWTFAQVGV